MSMRSGQPGIYAEEYENRYQESFRQSETRKDLRHFCY